MSFITESNIERMRQRWHANSYLRFLKLATNKISLNSVIELTNNFVLSRETETATGQMIGILTMHLNNSVVLTPDVLKKQILFVDLVHNTNGNFERWRLQSKTPPQQYEDRYICQLSAAFNDTMVIT